MKCPHISASLIRGCGRNCRKPTGQRGSGAAARPELDNSKKQPGCRQPDCVTNPVLEPNLADAGVASVIWATGYAADFGWLKVDAFDESGRPRHQRGVSSEPGVYFLGLPWLSRRGSSFIWGVWHDAKYIADQISIQRGYAAYGD